MLGDDDLVAIADVTFDAGIVQLECVGVVRRDVGIAADHVIEGVVTVLDPLSDVACVVLQHHRRLATTLIPDVLGQMIVDRVRQLRVLLVRYRSAS